MRSCLFFLGVSLSAFSCAYGTSVGSDQTGVDKTISGALGGATGSATLNLMQSVQLESGTSDILALSKVTINGASGGTKIAPSGTGLPYSLFKDSTSTTLELDFNNLTFQGFSADNGAIIKSSDQPGVTVGGIGSGPVTFMGNRATNEGGVIYANNGSVIFSGEDSVTFRGNQSADSGGAIAVSGSGNVSLYGTGVVNFSSNKAQSEGGAIYTDSGAVNLSGTGPVSFNCNSSQNGGAINAGGALTISGNVPAVFTNNTGLENGGAINAAGAVTLTNTQFMGNTAGMGGAVYMSSANSLTYKVDSSIIMNPSTGASQGDNDIAGVAGTTFNKTGAGDLTINTMNPGWLGTTNVNAGRFIVGENPENTGATWGGSTTPAGAITVSGTATLGGYGTINASGVTFQTGSTWLLGLNPNTQTAGLLSLTGTLALVPNMNVEIDGLMATSIPTAGYTVATFVGYTGDLVGLNKLLLKSNLTLDSSTSGSLILKQIQIPKPVQLGSTSGTTYPSINLALLAAAAETPSPDTLPVITLGTNTQLESVGDSFPFTGPSYSPSQVTVNGAAGGTTVQPATGISPFTLITTSSTTPALTLSGLTLQGFGSSGQGGAVNAVGPVTLTNTQFVGNSASGSLGGGAVYMSGNTLTYNAATGTTTVNPSATPATLGDNDIAGTSGASFSKIGAGDLVLNGTTFGGHGVVYANNMNFAYSGGSATWLLGLNSANTTPRLIVSGALTLPSAITIDATLPISLTGGYTVANYVTQGAGFTSALSNLNTQLAPYNLLLSPGTASGGYTPLVLTQTQISPGLFLGNFAPGTLAPLTQNVMVTFEVPGYWNSTTKNVDTTKPITSSVPSPGEGLLVRYGNENTAWNGASLPAPGSYFFSPEVAGDQGFIGQIKLNNHYVTSLAVMNNQLTAASGFSTVTPWSWTGSVALPVGQTYAWQLWKTRTYQSTDVEDGVASSYTGGWLAQGKLILTNTGILNVTYQITPNEGFSNSNLTPVTPS
ncbi:beta strand repeat-containing protein [Candidatus Finniella inopinata]|nr:hypothetical protein [Candidatus Finniella inopinata]